ncbi:predicted protein [Sclerotinia sclerotiorum 1980 UF-70]|uniref:Uncharacterized protein n=1 Tax=Sclerotinia sclerotiorum (strain ATCC 18683 / 1980 / Ss-1) TaxID=665079 RepID=A7F3U1_SCLS1|nr:predicted protein [Sclerotinia sclerotiorum 1980 UF-70]EDN97412.1 predicted protein [Sclerotinia sclerotiorum 1980 UF-70]
MGMPNHFLRNPGKVAHGRRNSNPCIGCAMKFLIKMLNFILLSCGSNNSLQVGNQIFVPTRRRLV